MPADPHREPVRTLLKRIVQRYYGKGVALAAAIERDPSLVSRWLSGERECGTDDLHRVVAAVVADHPSDAAVVGRWLLDALIGGELQVLATAPDLTPRRWEVEQIDGMTAEARLHMAVLNEDLAAFDAAAEDARRELAERIAAGRQRITGSAEGAVRLVGGAR
jgi:hypothetical protein